MGSIRAFMFHDIRDLEDTKYPERYKLKSFLRRNQFEFQISKIMSKYQIISSLDIKKIDLNNNIDYAVLTFDDGLRDHYYVYNYLKSLNISGTFFIPRKPIIENIVMDTHKIQFLLSVTNENDLTNEILNLFSEKTEIWEKYSKTKWKNNWWTKEMIFITNFLRNHEGNNVNRYELINFLFEKYVTKNHTQISKDLYLTESQINEMSINGMVIGGHGDFSENLLLVKSYKSEIDNSYEFVSKYSDTFVFSYPNGGFNDEIKSYLEYKNCFSSYTIKPLTITDLDVIDYMEFPRYDSPQIIELP